MKTTTNHAGSRISLVLALLVVLLLLPAQQVSAVSTSTFNAIITGGSGSDLLCLQVPGQAGTMKVKLDSSTSIGTRNLLPGQKIAITVYRGSDAYLHASAVTAVKTVENVTVNRTDTADVSGTIAEGTTSDLILLDVDNGQMRIKLDSDTDLSGVNALLVGSKVKITCGRGSDAYMHAIRITGSGSSSSASSAAGDTGIPANTIKVSGTVKKGGNAGTLYLGTNSGTMIIRLDSDTDISSGRIMTEGTGASAAVYRGSDAYLHAAALYNEDYTLSDVRGDASHIIPVSGTINSRTTPNTLYLDTTGGTMTIRFDSSSDLSKCGVLYSGRKVSVVCARGDDEYLHVLSVTTN